MALHQPAEDFLGLALAVLVGAVEEIDARVAAGTPWMEKRGERDSTSACLAWSETWVKPR